MMVDESRNTTVGVILGVFGGFMFGLIKLEVYGLVGEVQLIEDMSDFPVVRYILAGVSDIGQVEYSPSVGTTDMRVQGELFSVRHCSDFDCIVSKVREVLRGLFSVELTLQTRSLLY